MDCRIVVFDADADAGAGDGHGDGDGLSRRHAEYEHRRCMRIRWNPSAPQEHHTADEEECNLKK